MSGRLLYEQDELLRERLAAEAVGRRSDQMALAVRAALDGLRGGKTDWLCKCDAGTDRRLAASGRIEVIEAALLYLCERVATLERRPISNVSIGDEP